MRGPFGPVGCDSIAASGLSWQRLYRRHSGHPPMEKIQAGRHKHLDSQAIRGVKFFDKNPLTFWLRAPLYRVGIKQDAGNRDGGAQCAYRGSEADPHTGANVSVAPALGMISRRLVALTILAVAPSALQAQVGLTSGSTRITLIARVAPRASINGVSPAQETARRGALSEGTVKVRMAANTGYRLVVVGTAPVSSNDQSVSRVWVRAENGRFEELKAGTAVTVVRGHHADAASEPEVSFRSERSASGEGSQALPVRYEVRIDPTI